MGGLKEIGTNWGRATERASGKAIKAIPIVTWAPAYRRAWLRSDILAALAVWAVLVPQALAYASLARVPPQAGLYAALAASGIEHGPVFSGVRELWRGPGEVLARLELRGDPSADGYGLHPALLDAALQATVLFLEERPDALPRAPLVPFELGQVAVYSPGATLPMICLPQPFASAVSFTQTTLPQSALPQALISIAPRPVSSIQMPVGSEAADALATAAGIKLETANADAMTVTRRMTRSFYSDPIAMLALAR